MAKPLWSIDLRLDGSCVARVYADNAAAAMKLKPRAIKARDLAVHRVINAECPTPRLYRWLVAQAVARLSSNGFVVLDEGRWETLLSAAEGRELTAPEVK